MVLLQRICDLLVPTSYNYRFKETVLLDVFFVSTGFFPAGLARAVSIKTVALKGLIVSGIILSMFLAFFKRRLELAFLGLGILGSYLITVGESDVSPGV